VGIRRIVRYMKVMEKQQEKSLLGHSFYVMPLCGLNGFSI